jgi:hypothetical protein
LRVIIINILGYEVALSFARVLSTEFLKFQDCFMTSIRLAFFSKLNKIEVPLPDKLRVLFEKSIGKNLCGVSDSSIALLPEPIVSSECWNATGRT